MVGITIVGSIWDIWATRHGNKDPIWLWQFNHKETIGKKVFDVPIEEYLFYLATSVYVIFTWESIRLVSEEGNLLMFIVLPFCAVWSLFFIGIPYFFGFRNKDKF